MIFSRHVHFRIFDVDHKSKTPYFTGVQRVFFIQEKKTFRGAGDRQTLIMNPRHLQNDHCLCGVTIFVPEIIQSPQCLISASKQISLPPIKCVNRDAAGCFRKGVSHFRLVSAAFVSGGDGFRSEFGTVLLNGPLDEYRTAGHGPGHEIKCYQSFGYT